MATTTIDTDTELSAVNAILGAIGQSPISQLKDPSTGVIANANPEIQFIYNLLRDANVDTQAEGWHFNRERHVTFSKDTTTNKIAISNDIVKIDLPDNWSRRHYNFIRRGGYLYDKITHTDTFTDMGTSIELDVIRLYNYEDLPPVFKRYITYRASRMAATQLVANPQLVQLLGSQEALSRASLMEYECNQGNHSMMGFEDETSYQTYQPWRTLRR
tara:strand:- start:609 stop:1256 length:648 start_codon:yes stop_codon:yes gene_type:complete